MAEHEAESLKREGIGSLAEEIGELVQREVEQVTEALRAEIERLQHEAAERARGAASGAAYLGAAGGLGLVGVGAVASLPLFALRKVLPGWVLAVGIAGGAGAGATVLARRGVQRLAEVAPVAVSERIRQAKEEAADAVRARAGGQAAGDVTGGGGVASSGEEWK
jgi:nucleoside phosphorylase